MEYRKITKIEFLRTRDYGIKSCRSVGVDVTKQYDYYFWWNYVEYFRTLIDKTKVDKRILDRALWQYSKENQKNSYSHGLRS